MYIIDVSQFQGIPDFRELKREGVVAVYIKATEGETFVSPAFAEQFAKAGEAKLIRGTYHFARQDLHAARPDVGEVVAGMMPLGSGHPGCAYTETPNPDPEGADPTSDNVRSRGAVTEARHFVAAMRALRGRGVHAWHKGDLRPVLDFEVGTPDHRYSPWRDEFFRVVRDSTRHSTILYTFPAFNTWKRPPRFAAQLWIADFRGRSEPQVPGGYKVWNLWQYTSRGQLPGIHGLVDLSRLPHGRRIDHLRCSVNG